MMCAQSLSCIRLFATPWTVAHQAPRSMEFFRQKYWSGLPFLPPGDLPYPGIEPVSPAGSASTGGFFTTEPPAKPIHCGYNIDNELTHLKRPWCWKRLKAGGEGDDREWDGWMASPTQWTWVWKSSGSWWWTARPGVLAPVHGVAESGTTERLNWTELNEDLLYSTGNFVQYSVVT